MKTPSKKLFNIALVTSSVGLLAVGTAFAAGPGRGGRGGPCGDGQGSGQPGGGQMFDRFDQNGDGAITRSEHKAGVERMFLRMDRDGDGVVTKEEAASGPGRGGNGGPGRPERQAERFKAADENNDGKLSRDESFIPPAFFDDVDANHDGFLTLDEMKSARQRHQTARRDAHFARMDLNGDGAITKAESVSAGEAHFKELDKDKNGVVSRGEMKAFFEGVVKGKK